VALGESNYNGAPPPPTEITKFLRTEKIPIDYLVFGV
jgi:hypothetical protein